MRLVFGSVALAAALLALAPASRVIGQGDLEQRSYTVRDLATVQEGFRGKGILLNSRGDVLGMGSRPYRPETPFVLDAKGRLREVQFGPGQSWAIAEGMNDRDEIVGSARFDGSDNETAVLWHDDQTTRLGRGSARAINNRGQVAVSVYTDAGENSGLIWEDGRTRSLGDLLPDGINDRGQVVGRRGRDRSSRQAFLWDDGKLTPLGALPGCYRSEARAINDRGQVAGESMQSVADRSVMGHHDVVHPFLWSNGKMVAIPLPPGAFETRVYGLNNRGQVVGVTVVQRDGLRVENREPDRLGLVSPEGIETVAFLYENGRTVDLNRRLPPGFERSSRMGERLTAARSIDDTGRILATTLSGRTVLLTPR